MIPDPPLRPRARNRPGDAGFTHLGILGEPGLGSVDRGGAITPTGARWSLDWSVGAADRWHFPSVEAAVRQDRIGAGPVIVTAMRVPGGDCVARVWAARAGPEIVVIAEFENTTSTPVALGLSVPGATVDSTTIGIDDHVVRLERPAADLDPVGGTVVVPLPHRSILRAVIGSARVVAGVDFASLGDAPTAGRGWDAVVAAGGTVSLPDGGVGAQYDRARARLLLEAVPLTTRVEAGSDDAAIVLEGLAVAGFGREAIAALRPMVEGGMPTRPSPIESAHLVSAAGTTLALHDPGPLVDVDRTQLATEMLEPALGWIRRAKKARSSGLLPQAEAGLARLARRAGQHDAARSMHRGSGLPWTDGHGGPNDLDGVVTLQERAGESGAWFDDDAHHAARYVFGVRRLLVAETWSTLDLLPGFPTAWRGGPVDVRDLPTVHGRCSFAIRWHGPRPALLWEIDADQPLLLRCPTLDPEWSSAEPSGETLLAGTPHDLGSPPTEGESFS